MPQVPKTFAMVQLTRSLNTSVYTPPDATTGKTDLITDIQLSNTSRLPNPTAPTVTPTGTTGATSYTYYVVAKDAQGNTTMVSEPTVVTTGNATLSTSNYNAISWTAVPGAAKYDVLKGNMTTSLATNVTATTLNDTGQGTAAYTAPTTNNTGVKAFVDVYHVTTTKTSADASTRIVAGQEVDPGTPVDLQFNVGLAPGDTIQAKVFSGVNGDTSVDNNVLLSLYGVEFS